MAINVTNTTQLSTFDLVKNILLTNTTLSSKFSSSSIYSFDPLEKDLGFHGFPYIVIEYPESETDPLTLDKTQTVKEFTVVITLVMEWMARDNFTTYANPIISQLETSMTTFESSGYYLTGVGTEAPIVDVINQKHVITQTFRLNLRGGVSR